MNQSKFSQSKIMKSATDRKENEDSKEFFWE